MNAEEVALFPIRGRVDRAGCLVDADPPLAALHAQGGGRPGSTIAIPQLAALTQLVLRLQVAISRPVTAGNNGSSVALFVHARPEDDHVAIEIMDWTTQVTAPAPAMRTEQRERDFARAAVDFTWSVDAQLVLTGLSREAASGLGGTSDTMIGQPFTRMFSLFESPGGAMPMLDAFAGQRGFDGQQARLRGTDFGMLILSGLALFDEHGQFAGFQGSAVRAPEAETVEAEVAETADEAFGVEIGKVLKGPLDRIIANADVISAQADGPLRRGYADYAADIAAAGRHLMSLVEDLIELQTIERPDFRPEPEAIDLCDIARRAAGLLAVRAADSGVKIDRPAEYEKLPATGEFRRVLQILVNLLGNAVRYSPPGGMIWIRAEREADRAVLIVADQGKGIARDDQARIFEKFERLDRSEMSGSGLGLYISRRLARAMGGDLSVDSAPGQGARFILSLPARD